MPRSEAARPPLVTALPTLERHGYQATTLASLPLQQQLQAASRPGSSGLSILITAGSHADEIAGVAAAIEIASSYHGPHTLHAVPYRDPLGWLGFNAALAGDLSLPRSPKLETHEQVRAFLKRHAHPLYDDGDLIVARGNELAFASRHYSMFVSSDLARYQLQRELPDSAIAELIGRRILLPGSVATGPDRGPYDWGGSSAYVGADGWIGHHNRFFDRDDAPTEVRGLRDFVATVRPRLSLDLHEGFGTGFYLFVPTHPSAETLHVAAAMTAAVATTGRTLSTLHTMRTLWRPEVTALMVEHIPGVFSMQGATGPERGTFGAACAPYGPCITSEPGMNRSAAERTADIVTAATAALNTFQAQEAA